MTQSSDQTVYVVDDDPAIRVAMEALLDSVGIANRAFASADEFLADASVTDTGCLLLDIRMPGTGGLELQDALLAAGRTLPIIFITGHGDVPMAVEAIQKGASDFIQKPFRDQELLDRVTQTLEEEKAGREKRQQAADIHQRLERLTAREREVLDLMVTGKPNKVISYELGISQRTIEIHRARVMKKMEARSLAELVRMQMTQADT